MIQLALLLITFIGFTVYFWPMRTLELLKALSDREIDKIDALVKLQKRKSLQQLYSTLRKYIKRSGLPTNEELYLNTFEKKYTNDKNYLLRNELRLLNELIYDYLVSETFQTYLKNNRSTYYYWLARSFFDKKMNTSFEADIERFIAYCKEHVKPDDASRLLDLKSLWLIYNKEKTADNLRLQLAATEAWKDEQIRHLKHRLREMEARYAYIDHTLVGIEGKINNRPNDRRTPPQQIIDFGDKLDVFEEYLVLKKHSFETKQEVRINVLKRKLEIEESKEYGNEFGSVDAQVATLGNIATEYILLGKFEEADTYLLEGINRAEENDKAILPSLLQNYLANQMNLHQYQVGIDFYNKYETQMRNNRQYVSICMYKAYCHLFLKQPDEALASVPVNTTLTEHQNLLVRMIYLIAFIIRKDYVLAINESKNIVRMIKANEGPRFELYKWINNLYSDYLNNVVKDRTERKKAFQKLKQNMEADARFPQHVITEFSLRWINEETTNY